ncbi:hypothetical protein A3I40_01985 [Candidatus Uhrbacteria bacterium RIFCSPLOWO2_02_FULL_48_12]|uniref:bAvd-like domain-containing protein n=1 Tax=Candidatus Uhrbacteria bacterium RIFCSPLOWO2_02_FULL_48_12 TaxID=1802407 RepID=A0A1F7V9L7_9BACT|nr:MAG: hypothetical protein A3I40_01985 [Candidatus Uhrbacteria bacterium RIFCSPLOWO2_02_FULL_48_12]
MTSAYKLWHGYFADFPRHSRYTLGTKIDTLFLETVELILLAGYARRAQKLTVVERASSKLDALKFFLRISWELKALDNKKYTILSAPLADVGKMLGGWLKQLQNEPPQA